MRKEIITKQKLKQQILPVNLTNVIPCIVITLAISGCSTNTVPLNDVIVENKEGIYYKYNGPITIDQQNTALPENNTPENDLESLAEPGKSNSSISEEMLRPPSFLPENKYSPPVKKQSSQDDHFSSSGERREDVENFIPDDNKNLQSGAGNDGTLPLGSIVVNSKDLHKNLPKKVVEKKKEQSVKIEGESKVIEEQEPFIKNQSSEEISDFQEDKSTINDEKDKVSEIENEDNRKTKGESGQKPVKSSGYRLMHPMNNRGYIWPVNGKVIKHMEQQAEDFAEGISISAANNTPIRATADGKVAYINENDDKFGKIIIIKHPNNYSSAYAHNSAILVKKGEKVRRGQIIAKVGKTGDAGEPQLYFSLGHNNEPIDPEVEQK